MLCVRDRNIDQTGATKASELLRNGPNEGVLTVVVDGQLQKKTIQVDSVTAAEPQ